MVMNLSWLKKVINISKMFFFKKTQGITNLCDYYEQREHPVPQSIWHKPSHFVAFGFGSGAIPWMPGTFGTLLAIPFYGLTKNFSFYFYLVFCLVFMLGAIFLCDRVSKELSIHDHPGMNIDEFVGFFFAMLFVKPSVFTIISAFILFRFFDIVKPFPLKWLDQNINGGFGMIIDDAVAGLFTSIVLWVSLKVFGY